MAAPRKYPDELRERATRMAVEARLDPATRSGTFRRVGEQLGINPETLRNWVVQAEVDEGHRPGTTTSESQRLVELEKEVRELRRANSMADSIGRRNTSQLWRCSRMAKSVLPVITRRWNPSSRYSRRTSWTGAVGAPVRNSGSRSLPGSNGPTTAAGVRPAWAD